MGLQMWSSPLQEQAGGTALRAGSSSPGIRGTSKMLVFSHTARRETGQVPAPLLLNSPKEKAHGFGYVL